jgi:hypothetical protein
MSGSLTAVVCRTSPWTDRFSCFAEGTQSQLQKSQVKMGSIEKIFITHTHGPSRTLVVAIPKLDFCRGPHLRASSSPCRYSQRSWWDNRRRGRSKGTYRCEQPCEHLKSTLFNIFLHDLGYRNIWTARDTSVPSLMSEVHPYPPGQPVRRA